MQRIAVVGKTGSGKTTLARTLANRLNLEHIELDSIWWAPNWTNIPIPDFIAQVDQRTLAPGWTVDGNYKRVRASTWGRADTLVWLDYPLGLVLWRILSRTLRRSIAREVLWGKNVERLTDLFGRESLLAYAVRTHRSHRIDYPALLQQPEYQHLHLVRLYTPQQTDAWLQSATSPVPASPTN